MSAVKNYISVTKSIVYAMWVYVLLPVVVFVLKTTGVMAFSISFFVMFTIVTTPSLFQNLVMPIPTQVRNSAFFARLQSNYRLALVTAHVTPFLVCVPFVLGFAKLTIVLYGLLICLYTFCSFRFLDALGKLESEWL